MNGFEDYANVYAYYMSAQRACGDFYFDLISTSCVFEGRFIGLSYKNEKSRWFMLLFSLNDFSFIDKCEAPQEFHDFGYGFAWNSYSRALTFEFHWIWDSETMQIKCVFKTETVIKTKHTF